MRIPVLIAIPGQEAIRESAVANLRGVASEAPLRRAKVPSVVQIDFSFGAVPLGSLGDTVATAESLQPENSENFAVRGTLEVEDPEAIPTEVDGVKIYSDARIEAFPYCAGTAQGSSADVSSALSVSTLANKGLDGTRVAIAIMDTGINVRHLINKLGAMPAFDAANSWNPQGASSTPGQYAVGHGTMCAFDSLIAAPKATLLDYPLLATSVAGGNVTGRSISAAVQAFAHLLVNYAVAFAGGGTSKYDALVVSNSWGIYHPSWDFPAGHPGRYCDNLNHPFRAIVSALAAAGGDIVFAAGNCGFDCPDTRCQGRSQGAIMGANAYREVLTVAGCLVTNNDRLGYSSQGPSIANMPQEKPDITGYSHFQGSEAFGAGSPDSGTSTACPVVAGCIAAIRTKEPASNTTPGALIQQIQITASPAPNPVGGWNADYGHGIIHPVNLALSLGL